MEQTPTKTSILIRSRITEEEWAAIRKAAIDRDMLISDYTALLLREGRKATEGSTAA